MNSLHRPISPKGALWEFLVVFSKGGWRECDWKFLRLPQEKDPQRGDHLLSDNAV